MNNKYAREQIINRNLTIVISCLSLLVILLIVLCFILARPVKVEVIPDTNATQSVLSGNTQPHNVFGITTLVLLGLNTWEEDGEIEYRERIKDYRYFIDGEFLQWLISDYNNRQSGNNINELKYRTRQVKISEQFYKPSFVKRTSSTTFEVSITMEVIERIGKLKIKHYKGLFKVYVAKLTSPKDKNPWQLRIVGKPLEIKRIETYK